MIGYLTKAFFVCVKCELECVLGGYTAELKPVEKPHMCCELWGREGEL